MHVILYEHRDVRDLLPLTYLQPSFDLRCGMFTPWERASLLFPGTDLGAVVRPDLAEVVRERKNAPVNTSPGCPVVFLDGTVQLSGDAARRIVDAAQTDAVLLADHRVIGYTASSHRWRDTVFAGLLAGDGPQIVEAPAHIEVPACRIHFPWDIIVRNPAQMIEDARLVPLGILDETACLAPSTRLVEAGNISIGADARLGEGVVLDASGGPIVLDRGAEIMHNAVLVGPVYVGPQSKIKIGAKIYAGTSIGPVCKVGGEVEGTIFHSYANKQHEGFAGHSYFAAWTNLGADTNTSDLKNTYRNIRMTLEGTEYDTGTMFLGTIMADHSKCGINSMLTTGTSVGVCVNLFGAGYFPAYIPSFAWGGENGFKEYRFEMCAAVAETVMARRGCRFTEPERRLLRAVFDATAHQRAAWRGT
ncbi:MAG: putative sugar nucleotidyl transferase [Bacteroidota bacterium]|nr:putative sugar nucleotidyl transferase [Bacteroidota bacterium]